jgi:hypothetical protein
MHSPHPENMSRLVVPARRKGDRLCGLVVTVPDDRSRGPGSIPGGTRLVVGLERGPLSLVSAIEKLLGRKSDDSGLGNREYGHRGPPC